MLYVYIDDIMGGLDPSDLVVLMKVRYFIIVNIIIIVTFRDDPSLETKSGQVLLQNRCLFPQ